MKKCIKAVLLAVCCVMGPVSLADLVYPAATGTQYLSGPLISKNKVKLEGVADLDFTVVKALGVGNLDGKVLHAYFSRMVDGERVVDLQTDPDWVKGVRIIFSLESDGVYVRQDQAYYYSKSLGIGTYSWDDRDVLDASGKKIVNTGSIYIGSSVGNPYGIQELWLGRPETRTDALPEGTVTVGTGVELTLAGAAAAGTVANDLSLNGAVVTIDATENAVYSGTVSGDQGVLRIKTTPAVASQELSSVAEVTEDSASASLSTSSYRLLFAGARLADFDTTTIHSGEITQGTIVLVGRPYYLARAADGQSLTVEFQAQNTSDNWVKGAKVELVQHTDGVYGKIVKAFYYTGKMGSTEYEGAKTCEDMATDSSIMSGSYGIGKINATFTRYTSETFTAEVQGFMSHQHKHARIAQGYDLGDLEEVQVTETKNMTSSISSIVSDLTLKTPAVDGPEYQYQAQTSDGVVKCIFFRLVQTAENDILCYTTRAFSFRAATHPDAVFGQDLSGVIPDLDDTKFCIEKLDLRFARTAVPVVVTLSGANAVTSGSVIVTEGSRAHVVMTEAMPKKGVLEVQANARVTLSKGTASDCVGTLNIGKGAVVTTRGRTGLTGANSRVSVDGGTLRLMGSHEYECDGGDYFPSIELKNGALLSGYSPRANQNHKLLVTGTSCSTNNAGVMLGISSATLTYPVTVEDVTGDAGVDLEFSGPISAHPQANKGGIRKLGAGTMRLTSRFFSADPWLLLEEGMLLLGRSNMLNGEKLVVKGGTLAVEANVENNAVDGLDLQGDASLVLGANSTFNLGDVSSKTWADGAKLTVTHDADLKLGKDIHLYVTGLTNDQLRAIRVNGRVPTLVAGEFFVPNGTVLLFR